ncbi:leucyl aminopeptidase [Clostridiales bacterium PH28_bin88]|nr:leucyl aminopeptidase [Clostridiales bacterium PH28_bin88]
MDKLREAARVALVDCMGVKAGEVVLVVTDILQREVGGALLAVAGELGAEAMLMEMSPRENHGQEPPAAVAAAMREAEVVLMPTTKSLSHTRARWEANRAGARIASMPGITLQMMQRTLKGSYVEMAENCRRYASLLHGARQVRITTPAGTDLTMSLEGREAHPDTGLYLEPGQFGNLPAGEVYAAPLEGSTRGVLVIDGSMAGVGLLKEPIRMRVEGGYATDIAGGAEAAKLQGILDRYNREARNIAELGLGMNPHAMITGLVLEDEKVLGTVHVALGDNSTFGGNVEVASHLDGVMLSPTVEVDGKVVLAGGRLTMV